MTTLLPGLHPGRPRILLPTLVLFNFVSVLSGFVLVGFLPQLRAEFDLSATAAGLLVAAFTTTYAIASPMLGMVTTYLGYRRALTLAMAICAAAALASSLAPALLVLIGARMCAAIGSALYTPTAAALAVEKTMPDARGRVLTAIYLGVSLSQIVGIPLGAWLAIHVGWRVSFTAVAAMAAVMALALLVVVPAVRPVAGAGASDLRGALARPGVGLALAMTAACSLATNFIYTFVAAIIAAQVGFEWVPQLLVVMGRGVLVGTLATGMLLDHIGPL
ncbi:hypothetical protein GCM10011534_42820 [Pseudooceanicola nanhaiensis]|uniref:Major facilitator superfamily (MFS) profile domain-containing protein n=1 Tax=Pseudooceanicola nanhaiensis TaxID=375761 RepID=A0A917TAG8_9RHOB|nr:MFS transporter [Pseudooceanicola nanhaiensis]GGM16331.1 hypothetical protein GCM10011534_42820 [Pseudooceanicola nanhaiensis]